MSSANADTAILCYISDRMLLNDSNFCKRVPGVTMYKIDERELHMWFETIPIRGHLRKQMQSGTKAIQLSKWNRNWLPSPQSLNGNDWPNRKLVKDLDLVLSLEMEIIIDRSTKPGDLCRTQSRIVIHFQLPFRIIPYLLRRVTIFHRDKH